jgi:hypothetical protein
MWVCTFYDLVASSLDLINPLHRRPASAGNISADRHFGLGVVAKGKKAKKKRKKVRHKQR